MVLILAAVLTAPAMAGGYRHHHGWGAHYRHHGGGDEGAALAAGILLGGIIGYAISEDRSYRHHSYRHDPYPRYHPRPRYSGDYYGPAYREYRYAPRVYRNYVRVVTRPATTAVPVAPEFAGHACRMTREYTTTVDIDGQPRDAYGTRCLTADGSWVLGRPRLVPRFD